VDWKLDGHLNFARLRALGIAINGGVVDSRFVAAAAAPC
jgi:hypothetical protein